MTFNRLDVFESNVEMCAFHRLEVPAQNLPNAIRIEVVTDRVGGTGAITDNVVGTDLFGTLRYVGEGRYGEDSGPGAGCRSSQSELRNNRKRQARNAS